MIQRRDFFKSIVGLFVVATSPGSLAELLAEPRKNLELGRDFKALTRYMLEKIEAEITWPTKVISGSRLGDGPLASQYGIDLTIDPHVMWTLPDKEIEARFIDPVVACLTDELKRKRPAQFGKLPLPHGLDAAVRSSSNRVSLRGIRAFSMGYGYKDPETGEQGWVEPHWVARFDVLFG